VASYAKGEKKGVLRSAMGLVKTVAGNSKKAEKFSKATRTSPADVVNLVSEYLIRLLLTRGPDFLQWLQRQSN
jgi:hypothetical protein